MDEGLSVGVASGASGARACRAYSVPQFIGQSHQLVRSSVRAVRDLSGGLHRRVQAMDVEVA